MSTLIELIEFIKAAPGNKTWNEDKWAKALTKSVQNWRDIVQDASVCAELAKMLPENNELPCVLLKASGDNGLKLAERLLSSAIWKLKEAAIEWFKSYCSSAMWMELLPITKRELLNAHDFRHSRNELTLLSGFLNTAIWQDFDDEMKNQFLMQLFERNLRKSFRDIFHYVERVSFEYLDRRMSIRQRLHHFEIPLIYLSQQVGYPAPEIEKIRFIIEDANDVKYLARINKMISQRKTIIQNSFGDNLQFQNRTPYSPDRNERELIARLMEKTGKNGYLPAALPAIYISSEPPPLFIAYPELEANGEDAFLYPEWEETEEQILRNPERRRPDTLSIEELLAVYQPLNQQIVIYQSGIQWFCTQNISVDPEWLFAVVLIHEIAHWMTHQLSKPQIPCWSNDLYMQTATDVHEGWAQLMTWWIAEEVGGQFKQAFEQLNKNQSPPYRVYEQFKSKPMYAMLASLEQLRLLAKPASLQDWLAVID